MPEIRAQLLDQKIRKFKEFMDEFSKMFEQGHLNYNMWQSQNQELQNINQRLRDKNTEAENMVTKTMAANEALKEEGLKERQKYQNETMVLWTQAHTKFKEVEKMLDDAEKKRIKEALKDLEKLAVAV